MPDSTSSAKYHTEIHDGRGVVIGDGNIVIQEFTTGITALPTNYAVRIQNFLTEYLGTPGHPVPSRFETLSSPSWIYAATGRKALG